MGFQSYNYTVVEKPRKSLHQKKIDILYHRWVISLLDPGNPGIRTFYFYIFTNSNCPENYRGKGTGTVLSKSYYYKKIKKKYRRDASMPLKDRKIGKDLPYSTIPRGIDPLCVWRYKIKINWVPVQLYYTSSRPAAEGIFRICTAVPAGTSIPGSLDPWIPDWNRQASQPGRIPTMAYSTAGMLG